MAAPMSLLLSKSNVFRLYNRSFYTCPVLMKYNVKKNKNSIKKPRFLDGDIRFGKHETDLYETGMTLTDRFVDPAVQKKPPIHPETHGSAKYQAEHPYGQVYDKKPFPMVLKAGKRYMWCACGKSNRQPICDGNHKRYNLTVSRGNRTKVFPITFEVEEDGEYWLCNCKQSKNRPFCDGTHRKLIDVEKGEKIF